MFILRDLSLASLSKSGSAAIPSDITPGGIDTGLIIIFDVLSFFGLISILVVISTAWFSPRVHRTSLWFLFMSSFAFTSISNLLLLGQQTGRQPNFGLCIFQASLVYAAPVINCTTGLSFMIHVWLSIRNPDLNTRISRRWIILLHLLPLLLTLATIIEVLAVGLIDPKRVVPDTSAMFCHISSQISNRITSSISVVCMLTILVIDAFIIRILRSRWKAFQRTARPLFLQPDDPDPGRRDISLDSLIRVVAFALLPIIAIVVSFAQYFPRSQEGGTSARTNIVIATLPPAAFFIFGTQRDLLRAWGVMKPEKEIHWQRRGVSDNLVVK
ncbi:hypothetical protein BJ165DRAFT_1517190 [Panaeolus papilionaceus]|nr:hypothetical protein BJ165DRAFT_1517190 [Panaeolus papilionaceus]